MTEQGPLSGQKVGEKYLLGELLGEGGFGAVYKAQHLQIQRQQAIKVLLEHHFRKQDFRDRFFREAQTVAALDHPCIIHLDDFWVEPSRAYLVMPFISGGTLQDILRKQQGFLKLEQITSYLEYICTALDYAHERGVVHLDLKPLNLLVHNDGRLLLSDFGLAHLMKQGAVEGGSSLKFGTPHYMAPEHIKGHPERRSDIFSLGIILYQMLVGKLPFEGLAPEAVMIKNIMEWPLPPRTYRPELPQAVEDMLGRSLAKQPEQRYQTASDFLIAFKNALHSAQKPVSPFPIREQLTGEIEVNPPRPHSIPPKEPPVLNIPGSIAYIYIEEGKESGRVYEIHKDSLSIGRSREADVFLEDLALSRLHASILSLGNGYYAIRDEGSANGTKVNNQQVTKYQPYPLQEGDKILVGQTVLVFRISKIDQVVPPILPSPKVVWQPAPALRPLGLGRLGCIRVEEGRDAGRVYEIHNEHISIGRSRESDVFLEDLAVSRLQASIVSLGNGNYAVRDEGSAHGTKVNGQIVNKYQPYPLQEGDKILVGQTVLVFFRR